MSLKIKPSKTICAFKNCKKKGIILACGRESASVANPHIIPDYYCEEHADLVSDEGYPEYRVLCPNCKCRFGVN